MIYNVYEVAAQLRLHPRTVRSLVRRGDLDCARIGDGPRARIRITQQQLDAYLVSRSGRVEEYQP